jgi:hypothetical protein
MCGIEFKTLSAKHMMQEKIISRSNINMQGLTIWLVKLEKFLRP